MLVVKFVFLLMIFSYLQINHLTMMIFLYFDDVLHKTFNTLNESIEDNLDKSTE